LFYLKITSIIDKTSLRIKKYLVCQTLLLLRATLELSHFYRAYLISIIVSSGTFFIFIIFYTFIPHSCSGGTTGSPILPRAVLEYHATPLAIGEPKHHAIQEDPMEYLVVPLFTAQTLPSFLYMIAEG